MIAEHVVYMGMLFAGDVLVWYTEEASCSLRSVVADGFGVTRSPMRRDRNRESRIRRMRANL